MRVTADRERCVGAGQCALTAPEIFGRSADGRVLLLTERPPEASATAIRWAIAFCPSRALALSEG